MHIKQTNNSTYRVGPTSGTTFFLLVENLKILIRSIYKFGNNQDNFIPNKKSQFIRINSANTATVTYNV